jgi:phosphoglycolate phosphatase
MSDGLHGLHGDGERGPGGAAGFDGVIFDLDGTLVDTLEDIADAMDRVLALEGAPGHSYDEYRYLIGRGIRTLVTEALPAELRSAERIERCYARMLEDYGAHLLVKTRAYEGVPELVRALRADGVPLAVHSNKADSPTQAIVAALLDPDDFVVVAGARPDAPLKPDPAVALEIAGRFGLSPSRVVYLGDSLVDMRTATAAGMIAVGAAWGFRTPGELVESGAQVVIDAPLDLLDLRG